MIQLSKRLQAAANMVTLGSKVADIGCDHAYLSIYLAQNNISNKIIACDINAGPIAIARDNISRFGLSTIIECRQGNGLNPINPGEVNTVVIAGMGGHLVTDILAEGSEVLANVNEIIIGAQSDLAYVRRFLADNNYLITDEDFLYEDGKYYPIIRVVHGKDNVSEEVYFRYGRLALVSGNRDLYDFLDKEKSFLQKLIQDLKSRDITESGEKRLKEVERDLLICRKAIDIMQMNID